MNKMHKRSTLSRFPVVLLVLALGALTLAYFRCAAFQPWLKDNHLLLDGWNSLAALSVFAFLYYTLDQFRLSQRAQTRQELGVLAQRLSALSIEMEMNMEICKEILKDKEEYLRGAGAPFNHFHSDVLRHFVTEGMLDDETLRGLIGTKEGAVSSRKLGVTLGNAYHYLLQGSDFIECGINIMTLQIVAQTPDRTNARLINYMTYLVETAEKLEKTLTELRPIINELGQSARQLSA